MSSPKYFFVKVIEASALTITRPFVALKVNGHDHKMKKKTGVRTDNPWWSETFRFKIRHPESDWITLELRDQDPVFSWASTWRGETHLRIRDFNDGRVHENWFALGPAGWKHHTLTPQGHLHVTVQLLESKTDTPFEGDKSRMNLDEWIKNQEKESGQDTSPPLTADSVIPEIEMTYPDMVSARNMIKKNCWNILMNEEIDNEQILRMKRLNKVNCLHRGEFERCTGRKYLVTLDGMEESEAALKKTLQMMDVQKDHIFIVTVREKIMDTEFDEKSRVILSHHMWKAAAGIVKKYQMLVEETAEDIHFTSVLPESADAREIVCALVRKYKIDVLVIGKHKGSAEKKTSKLVTSQKKLTIRHVRSFSNYCQTNAKCSVVVM